MLCCFVLCCVVLCCAVLCCLVIFILPMKPNKLPRPSHSVLQSCSLHTNTFTVMTNRNDLRNTTLQGWLTYLSTKLPARTACQWKKRHQSAYISLIVTLFTTYTSFPGKYRIYDLLFCISRDLNLGIALAIFVKGRSLNLYTLFWFWLWWVPIINKIQLTKHRTNPYFIVISTVL